MDVNLKKEVIDYYSDCKDVKKVCQHFKGKAFPDTLKRWCLPELNELAKIRSKKYHDKNKNNITYKEKRRLASQKHRTTEVYKSTWKEHYSKTKERRKQLVQEHRLKNIEQYKEKAKNNYQQNKERYRKQGKEYYNNNKKRLQNIELQRYHSDPITNLKHNLRISLNRALQYGATKNNKALRYLGCDIDTFKRYIEAKFETGMSWLNRGEWHIDHIIPLAKINNGYTLEQLCHYSNLQPLWKKDNLIKSKNTSLSLEYTQNEISDELEYYKHTEGNYGPVPSKNKIVLNYQPHFYDYERVLWQDSFIQEKLINNRCKYLNKTAEELTVAEILRGFKISGIHYGYSHFSPLWFKKFITDFNIKTVYDPCGGWGHRLLGTLGTNLQKYHYNDFDLRTVKGIEEIVKFTNLTNKIEITNFKAEEFIPNKQIDAIFTCPPYYNKETYNNREFKSIEDYSTWWSKVVKNCLQTKCKYFAVVIDSDHQEIIKEPLKSHILIFQNKLGKNRSHFTKESSAHENILVYQAN
jgi:hypothetical protein